MEELDAGKVFVSLAPTEQLTITGGTSSGEIRATLVRIVHLSGSQQCHSRLFNFSLCSRPERRVVRDVAARAGGFR